jgi:hypothetical protein
MYMPSFNGFYSRKIHSLSMKNGTIPTYGIGELNHLPLTTRNESVTALMAIVTPPSSSRQFQPGKIISLQEILTRMPIQLRNGMLSWLVFEGEEVPSSLIIHTGISQEDLVRFAEMRLGSMALEPLPKRVSRILTQVKAFHGQREALKELARKSKLTNSEPVSSYLK